MGILETRLEQLGIFLMLIIAYGVGVGGINVQNTFNNIFAPWPNFGGVFHLAQCGSFDFSCNAQNIQTATAAIAVSIDYPAILFFTIISRISAFGSLLIALFFGPELGVQSVPFMDAFFLFVFVVAPLVEVFRLFRGNSSGSTL